MKSLFIGLVVLLCAGCAGSFDSGSSGAEPPRSESSVPGLKLTLTWDDNSSNESGFQILRRNDVGSFIKIAEVASNVTTYVDTSVAAGTTYCYTVVAFNDYGNSSPSNEACAAPNATGLVQWKVRSIGQ